MFKIMLEEALAAISILAFAAALLFWAGWYEGMIQ